MEKQLTEKQIVMRNLIAARNHRDRCKFGTLEMERVCTEIAYLENKLRTGFPTVTATLQH